MADNVTRTQCGEGGIRTRSPRLVFLLVIKLLEAINHLLKSTTRVTLWDVCSRFSEWCRAQSIERGREESGCECWGLSVTGVTRSHICSNSSNLFPFRRLRPSHRCVGRAEVSLEAVTYSTTGLTEHMETKLLSHMP